MNTITRKRGDDYSIFLYLTDEDNEKLNITGATFILSTTPKRAAADANYGFQITGAIVGLASQGVVEFVFDSSAADNLGKFYYDIEMLDAGGKTRTVDDGTIIFNQDIGK